MNLTEEIQRLDAKHRREEDLPHDPLWYAKVEIWQEMAKRIEALERREHSRPLGAGSLRLGKEG